VAEWSKALAWKVSIRQKRIEGSNPSRSAIPPTWALAKTPLIRYKTSEIWRILVALDFVKSHETRVVRADGPCEFSPTAGDSPG
jgi:hypothetical protein